MGSPKMMGVQMAWRAVQSSYSQKLLEEVQRNNVLTGQMVQSGVND